MKDGKEQNTGNTKVESRNHSVRMAQASCVMMGMGKGGVGVSVNQRKVCRKKLHEDP